MNTNRNCGCKSFRTCFICEKEFGFKSVDIARELVDSFEKVIDFDAETHKLSDGTNFPGIKIIPDFVSEEEESKLVKDLDEIPWDQSQSGRRKQNFGPRANFKKRKTKVGGFRGFPQCTEFIQRRFESVPSLEDYKKLR